MKEIQLATILAAKRREKGITQDELAAYIGVSKASVSKWETGTSYPDITFLPQLAAYFNISIDELMGYSPQLPKEEITKLYRQLTAKFASQPFEEALAECQAWIRKYYACFPLLLQMAGLLLNHHMLAPHPEQKSAVLRQISELCERTARESEDVWLAKDAAFLHATCRLMLGEPQSALDLLGEEVRLELPATSLIAQAYHQLGQADKAKEVLQAAAYQQVMSLLGAMPYELLLHGDQLTKAEEILRRAEALSGIYRVEALNPNLMIQLYMSGAQLYMQHGLPEKALDMLGKYVEICSAFRFPAALKGDDFFDRIGPWLAETATAAPREEPVIKASMVQGLTANPALASLKELPAFHRLIARLKSKLEVQ